MYIKEPLDQNAASLEFNYKEFPLLDHTLIKIYKEDKKKFLDHMEALYPVIALETGMRKFILFFYLETLKL